MPVPVETFRNIKRVNAWFAASSILLLVSMVWMLWHDYSKPWREEQNKYFDLQSGLAHLNVLFYESPEQVTKREELENTVAAARAKLETKDARERENELTSTLQLKDGELAGAAIRFGNLNAEIQVTLFEYEEFKTLHGEKAPETIKFKEKLNTQQAQLEGLRAAKQKLEDEISGLKRRTKEFYAERDAAQKQLDFFMKGLEDARRNETMYGPGLTRGIFNAPTIDFLAPLGTPGHQQIRQVFMPEIRINYNFLDSYVTDRCMTCHVGIDNPALSVENFIEKGEAALAIPAVAKAIQEANESLRPELLSRLSRAGNDNAIEPSGKDEETLKKNRREFVDGLVSAAQSYLRETDRPEFEASREWRISLADAPDFSRGRVTDLVAAEFMKVATASRPDTSDGKGKLRLEEMSYSQRKSLAKSLAAAVNEYLVRAGRRKVNFSQPLTAHPRLDLFVSPDSKHPMNKMGCTVCHEGSGQETDFVLAAHTPKTHEEKEAWEKAYYDKEAGVPLATFHLVEEFWERPMLLPDYTSASCVKCHHQVADLERNKTETVAEAKPIVKGRDLFTAVGCINCHNVDGLSDSRRVGPDLTHVGDKLTTGFIERWVEYPANFRPSTRMPHLFLQENNTLPNGDSADPDPNPLLRTESEIQAMTHYLKTFTRPFEAAPLPQGIQGDATRGEEIFISTGCLACHANLEAHDPTDEARRTFGEKWLVTDMVMVDGKSEEEAKKLYADMSMNDRVREAMHRFTQDKREAAFAVKTRETLAADAESRDPDPKKMYIPPEFTRLAPELSGVGSKLAPTAGDTGQHDAGMRWLYNWLLDPRHYSSTTKMPRLFEDGYYWRQPADKRTAQRDQDLTDLAAYLMTLRNDAFQQTPIADDDAHREMTSNMVLTLLAGQNTDSVSRKILNDEKTDPAEAYGRLSGSIVSQVYKSFGGDDAGRQQAATIVGGQDLAGRQKLFLGMKMISHYGCYACHVIPGFEDAARPGTDMSRWGDKFVTQLDFAFFSPPFEHEIEYHKDVFGDLYRELPGLEHLIRDAGGNQPQEILHNHAAFAYHKLRNPRIWDREKIKKPYDKLKMPNFYLSDDEAKSLVTFLLSRREPMVRPSVQVDYDNTPAGKIAKGRALVKELNCVGCHKIEGNPTTIHQYYPKEGDDTDPFSPRFQPPLLWGEGAKVQSDWLYGFLNHVIMLRPWLNLRMPSFYLTSDQATTLVEYFAGVSQDESRMLRDELAPIQKFMADAQTAAGPNADPGTIGQDWFAQPKLLGHAEFLKRYALAHNQIKDFDLVVESTATEAERIDSLASTYDKIKNRAAFLSDVYDIEYPFPATAAAATSDEQFKVGEEFFYNQKCLACHVAGDPNAEGTTTDIKAPNFALAHRRLRYEWFKQWITDPQAIQPGANMPQIVQGGKSVFSVMADEQRKELEAKFGATAEGQIQMLADFVYELGRRGHTSIQPREAAPPPAEGGEQPQEETDFGF